MAIFQIKVNYVSKNQHKGKISGKSAKNLSYISRGTSSGRARKSISYISRDDEYKNRDDLIHYEEKNIPKEFSDGKDFVNTMEEHSRSNARLLKKYEMSLPREFSNEENVKIAQEFCEKKFGNDYTYFLAVHNPKGNHPHLHLSLCERKLDGIEREKEKYFKRANSKNPELGGIKVNNEFATEKYFEKFCKDWEEHLNKHLIRNGYEKLSPKKDKFQIENKTLEVEKIKSYSKAEIEKMDIKEVSKILLDSEKRIHENEKKIQKLYKKNIDREVLNELSGNKLYKLENKIKNCEISKRNSNFTSKERGDFLRQGKALKMERDNLIDKYKGTEKYYKIKKQKESEKRAELKKLNAENTKLKNNIEKIVKMKSTEEMNNIKGNIKKIKSVNLKKNARVRNQRNRIKKNQNSYTAGEKKTINRKYQNSMSKTMQVISLFKKINALKNIGRTGQDNASRISIMKVGKKYERLKKGGIFSEDLQKEKTQNYEQNLDQSREQNQEQNKGKVRSRIR